ncbi:MAG: hypothetical protein NTW19_14640 [Planctomycetota bacterium]|nr:hypothetical protein [Planctomycetota bacterium]
MLLAGEGTASAQVLNLDAPEAATLPTDYLRQRLERVERELNRLGGPDRRPSEEMRALVWAASREVRLLAADLLRTAVKDGSERTATSALLGLKLAGHAEEIDAVLAEVPQAAQVTTTDQKSQGEVDRWRQATQSLAKFGAGAEEQDLDWTDAAKVRGQLAQRMSLLLPIYEALGRPDAATTWLAANPGSAPEIVVPAAAPALEAQLAAVTTRVAKIADADLKLAAEEMLAKVRAAKEFSDLRPRLEAALRLLGGVADLAEALDEAPWFGAARRSSLVRELSRGLAMYVQPGKRREATTRVENTLAFLPAIRALGELRRRHIESGPLEAAVGAAASLPDDPAASSGREAVLEWVGAAAAAQVERSNVDPATVGEMRPVYAKLDLEFMKRWAALLVAARQVGIQPQAASTPEATAPLAALRKMGASLQNVARLSDRVAKAGRWSGRPPGEMSARLRAAAGELLTDNDQQAAALLERFARQVDRFASLPGEAALRGQEYRSQKSDWPCVGARAQALLQVIDEQRSAWAQAWSTGQDPAAAQKTLATLARLMLTIRNLEALRDAEPALATLNRWAAVELDPAVVAPRVARALRACDRIVDAVVGLPASSLGTLELDRPDLPVALVAAGEAYIQLGPRLAKLPDDGALALGQSLFGPTPGSFWGEHENDLAVLSRCLNEMPARGGTPQELLDAAGVAARRLLAEE